MGVEQIVWPRPPRDEPVRPYQVIFLFLIQLLSGNKCGRAQSKHTQAKKHWVISVKNDHVMPGKKADPRRQELEDLRVIPTNSYEATTSAIDRARGS